jgi:hypothetical protein
MVHHLGRDVRRRRARIALAVLVALAACGGKPVRVAGPRIGFPEGGQVPPLQQPQFGGGGAATALGGEQLAQVSEAAPPGLHITTLQISVLSKAARDALRFTGFRSGHGPGLITLPIYGINPQLGLYYLIVPVVNEGTEPVRNLKARADFLDADGVIVWSETQAVTHLPTRLGLNPPSLPNDPNAPAGELGLTTHHFGLYYFAGNVGLFTFAVPDPAVAKTVVGWKLTFLVSTT